MAGTSYTISELAEIVGGNLRGKGGARIEGVAEVSEAGADQATWITDPRYVKKLSTSQAGVVLVPLDFPATSMPAILCDRVDRSVAKLLAAFAPHVEGPTPGVHPSAQVHSSAQIGRGTLIGPHAVIEANVRLGNSCVLHAGVFVGTSTTFGDNCVIWPNAVLRERCTIGRGVTIHSCAVIGADGFGYYRENGRYQRVPHIGGVVLEDDVEVGACSCIDRAKFGNTVIGRGTKIDNLVQIGHNARVGADCVLVGQSGMGGSVHVGDGCSLGGQAGIIDNLVIGAGASIGACAVVTRDVEPGVTVTGWPIQEVNRALRTQALISRLPELAAEIKELLARVEKLEAAADHRP